MSLPDCKHLLVNESDGIVHLILNRPEKRNAMNADMVAEIMSVIDYLKTSKSARALVLRGAGGNFCAGGDISGMKNDSSVAHSRSSNSPERDSAWEFNRLFGHLIDCMNSVPQLVIAMLEGAVLGGGFGLACVSDVAIADRKAKFAMPETGLGIIPAQIAPFVVARIGLTQSRRLALLGEKIDGVCAQQLGIVHHVVDGEAAMSSKLEEVVAQIRRCAPNATAITKQLLLDATNPVDMSALLDRAADDFSAALNSEEGQEGTLAFVERRKPRWAE